MINRALALWNHWNKGELSAFVPDPSVIVSELVLIVDQEVAALRRERNGGGADA